MVTWSPLLQGAPPPAVSHEQPHAVLVVAPSFLGLHACHFAAFAVVALSAVFLRKAYGFAPSFVLSTLAELAHLSVKTTILTLSMLRAAATVSLSEMSMPKPAALISAGVHVVQPVP